MGRQCLQARKGALTTTQLRCALDSTSSLQDSEKSVPAVHVPCGVLLWGSELTLSARYSLIMCPFRKLGYVSEQWAKYFH